MTGKECVLRGRCDDLHYDAADKVAYGGLPPSRAIELKKIASHRVRKKNVGEISKTELATNLQTVRASSSGSKSLGRLSDRSEVTQLLGGGAELESKLPDLLPLPSIR